MGCVVADSTFYILFYGDLEDPESLYHILKKYELYVGEQIKRELEHHIYEDKRFKRLVKDVTVDVNFVKLLREFYNNIIREFPQITPRITDGEFEAMGLSYLLKQYEILKYLVLDDKQAHKFVENQLVTLKPYLVWTVKFLYNGHSKDMFLEKEFIKRIFYAIKEAIIKGRKPLHLTEHSWELYVKPLLVRMEER